MALARHRLTPENIVAVASSLRVAATEDEELKRRVAQIITRVREGGDAALVELTRELDSPDFTAAGLKVSPADFEAARSGVSDALIEALKTAAENVRLFHQHEMRGGWTATMRQNQMLGQRLIPVDRAGLYVPGGKADYPSSVLMTVVPAQVAGVKEIFICTPPDSQGRTSSAVLAAAEMLGIEEIYRVGGAQAVAAMAWGTESIRPADVICGPGNIFVTEAKRQAYGQVGLDSLAGPSEVLIIADEEANPELIAADLLAQVEHGSGAGAILVCWSEELAGRVETELARLGAELEIAPGRQEHVAVVMADAADPLSLAVAFSNSYGPEHLQVHTAYPEQVVHEITCAGAVFLGEEACTAYGDYIIGSNHVLPTGGSARFDSALSVENFLRKVAVISLIPETITRLTPPLVEIARTEGLRAHARAAELREQLFGQPVEEQ